MVKSKTYFHSITENLVFPKKHFLKKNNKKSIQIEAFSQKNPRKKMRFKTNKSLDNNQFITVFYLISHAIFQLANRTKKGRRSGYFLILRPFFYVL